MNSSFDNSPGEENKRPAEHSGGPANAYGGTERRAKLRVNGWFPATVRGDDRNGDPFQHNALIENISAGGFYLRLHESVEPGAMLYLATRLSTPTVTEVYGPLVLIQGRVVRVEPQPGGEQGLGVAIVHCEFP